MMVDSDIQNIGLKNTLKGKKGIVDNSTYSTTHRSGASKIKMLFWYLFNIVFFKNSLFPFTSLKPALLRIFGAKVGKGVIIKPSVNIKYPWKLIIGDHSWIGEKVWIDNLSEVTLGKSVCISQGALLLTGSHDHTKTTFDFMASPIILDDGVWIGAKAVVGGGVRCHSHCILGINSVAETNLKAYTIYKGNPAIPVVNRNITG